MDVNILFIIVCPKDHKNKVIVGKNDLKKDWNPILSFESFDLYPICYFLSVANHTSLKFLCIHIKLNQF